MLPKIELNENPEPEDGQMVEMEALVFLVNSKEEDVETPNQDDSNKIKKHAHSDSQIAPKNFQNDPIANKCVNSEIKSIPGLNYASIILANMKTAFMLFVVTVIMAVVYTPALLTSLGYLPYNPIYWNIIYINNAINPLVYSFLNPNFRQSLRTTFSKYFKRKSSLNI